MIIGGVTGCKFAIEEELSGFDKDSTVMRYAEDIMVYMGQWDRTLFSYDGFDLGDYSGTVKCPTPWRIAQIIQLIAPVRCQRF